MRPKRTYEIDGTNFSILDEFYEEIAGKLIPGVKWGRNLDAFNDILRGGFGTPENGFVLRWNHSELSRKRLGYDETIRVRRAQLLRIDSPNLDFLEKQLAAAEAHTGRTIFEWLVEIILKHCPGGSEQEDGVELELR